mmetsp:Transcript_1608/g.2265  ORF Transcript_1608/g.2265 Transcript_1608/m.2265 type:complete len:233 (-) Transcript_1608:710-1408(-)
MVRRRYHDGMTHVHVRPLMISTTTARRIGHNFGSRMGAAVFGGQIHVRVIPMFNADHLEIGSGIDSVSPRLTSHFRGTKDMTGHPHHFTTRSIPQSCNGGKCPSKGMSRHDDIAKGIPFAQGIQESKDLCFQLFGGGGGGSGKVGFAKGWKYLDGLIGMQNDTTGTTTTILSNFLGADRFRLLIGCTTIHHNKLSFGLTIEYGHFHTTVGIQSLPIGEEAFDNDIVVRRTFQ